MTLRTYLLSITLLLLLASGCSPSQQSDKDSLPRADYSAEEQQWADSVMRTMSLEQRVGQLIMPAAYPGRDDEEMQHLKEYINNYHVGGILFLRADAAQLSAAIDTVQHISAVPLFTALDAEWGLAMRINDAPQYPMFGELPTNISDQTMYDYGQELARQARLLGLNMIMAPVVDVVNSPLNTAIGKRSFGNDPERVATLATSFAQGLEDGNVISVAKHFPGHGGTLADSHQELPVVNSTRAQLESVDLLPFNRYIDQNLSGIMIGHLYMPALDSIYRSASISPKIINDLLVNQLHFHGLIITDALNMKGVQGSNTIAADAIRAGADIILAPVDTEAEINSILQAIKRGDITLKTINDKCRKILAFKYRFARDPYHSPAPYTLPKQLHRIPSPIPEVQPEPKTKDIIDAR